MKSKMLGNLGVVEAIKLFQQKGAIISIPFGDVGDYDLLVDLNGDILRIQCKSSESYNGKYTDFKIESCSIYTNKKYDTNNIDLFFLYDIKTGRSFLYPPKSGSKIRIRYVEPANKQNNGVNLATDYDFNTFLDL